MLSMPVLDRTPQSWKCTPVFLPSTCLSVVLDNESFIYLNFMGAYSGPGTGLGTDQFSDQDLPA